MPPSPPSPPRRSPPAPAYKHFCRVCNKGFTCGSALGGHMRAHGVGDDGLGADDDDDVSLGNEPTVPADGGAWDTAGRSTAGTATTHVYALRANPNRLIRSCQVCKNCGKEFSSMELFLEHGKCNYGEGEDADGSPHSSPPSVADGEDDASLAAAGWSKGKRSRRARLIAKGGDDDLPAAAPSRCPSGEEEEEEDLANCLVMLSSSQVDQASGTGTDQDQEPCASASNKEHGKRPQLVQPFSFVLPAPDPAMVLPLALPAPQYVLPVPRGMFECKACKKVFTSHQALGGHRASHKKVKGCFAAKPESSVVSDPPQLHAAAADPNDDKGNAVAVVEVNANGASADARTNFDASTVAGDTNAGTSKAAASLSMAITTTVHEPPPVAALAVAPYKKKAKMHECSVCHRLFSSGQALGGHKRCHWLTSSAADHANLTPFAAEGLLSAAGHQLTLRPMPDAPEPALDLTIAANPLPTVIATARVAEVGNSSLHLDASAPPLYFQPSVVPSNATHQNKTAATTSSHHNNVNDAAVAGAAATAEDEADSTSVKRARLSDLKDVSTAGETTPWLQVGIGSSSAGGDGTKSTRE